MAQGLPVGMHDLAIGRASVKEALAVYDKIAYIQVEPDAQMSRLGGIRCPKEYCAVRGCCLCRRARRQAGYRRRRVARTGVRRAGLSRNSFRPPMTTTSNIVGSLDDSGLFTPNVEGPESPAQEAG